MTRARILTSVVPILSTHGIVSLGHCHQATYSSHLLRNHHLDDTTCTPKTTSPPSRISRRRRELRITPCSFLHSMHGVGLFVSSGLTRQNSPTYCLKLFCTPFVYKLMPSIVLGWSSSSDRTTEPNHINCQTAYRNVLPFFLVSRLVNIPKHTFKLIAWSLSLSSL